MSIRVSSMMTSIVAGILAVMFSTIAMTGAAGPFA